MYSGTQNVAPTFTMESVYIYICTYIHAYIRLRVREGGAIVAPFRGKRSRRYVRPSLSLRPCDNRGHGRGGGGGGGGGGGSGGEGVGL
jgi:hypothetical protein